MFEIEAAIKTLYSKAQDKLLLLGQFENDAATAKDYKGAATMKRNYVSHGVSVGRLTFSLLFIQCVKLTIDALSPCPLFS